MYAYTFRLELVGNPSEETYQKVHRAMAGVGYGRTVPGIDGAGNSVTVNLPTGLYYGSSNALVTAVRDSVFALVNAIHSVKGVFVALTQTWASR